jgi:hypothetical protein
MFAHNNDFKPYGEAFSEGDVVATVLDLEAKTVSFAINGTDSPNLLVCLPLLVSPVTPL